MFRKQLIFLAAALVTVILVDQSCAAKKTATDECGGMQISYAQDLKAIIDKQCAGCHNATKPAGGINLTTYETVKAISGEARFMGAIRHLAGYDAMPANSPKLADSVITKIGCWVKKGTPE